MADTDVIMSRVADTGGLVRFVRNHIDDIVKEFAEALVREVARRNGIDMDASVRDRTLDRFDARAVDVRPGATQKQVLSVIADARDEGVWGDKLDDFLDRNGDLPKLRAGERRAIIRALKELPVRPTDPNPAQDHTIARVYEDTVGTAGGTDPVALTRPPGRITPWNFQVKPFEASRYEEPRSENILAAGALMWCFEIGERMGVYKISDALVYRWWIGQADFRDPDLVAQLYRYYKLRDERLPEEDRALLYRRILGLGGAPTSGRVVVNDAFPELWRSLMEEISVFIEKSESSYRDDQVSRQGIYQATRELQNNLGEHMVGMSLLHVTEMYNQLRSDNPGNLGALDILEHEEVAAQFSMGLDRSASSVIRRLAAEEFGVAPNVTSIATSADRGYEVFEWIADYRPGAVDDDRLLALVGAGKAWILAQGAAGEGLSSVDEPAEDYGDGYGEGDPFAEENAGWEAE